MFDIGTVGIFGSAPFTGSIGQASLDWSPSAVIIVGSALVEEEKNALDISGSEGYCDWHLFDFILSFLPFLPLPCLVGRPKQQDFLKYLSRNRVFIYDYQVSHEMEINVMDFFSFC